MTPKAVLAIFVANGLAAQTAAKTAQVSFVT
mgnify:CR=1 FL=1